MSANIGRSRGCGAGARFNRYRGAHRSGSRVLICTSETNLVFLLATFRSAYATNRGSGPDMQLVVLDDDQAVAEFLASIGVGCGWGVHAGLRQGGVQTPGGTL